MAAGRNRKNPRTAAMEGNRRKVGAQNAVQVATKTALGSGIPQCPSYLSKSAKEEWRRVVKHLIPMGLEGVDRSALADYCQQVADIQAMSIQLSCEGLTVTTPNGYVREHPLVGMRHTLYRMARASRADLGLTPAARVQLPVHAEEEEDEFAAFQRKYS